MDAILNKSTPSTQQRQLVQGKMAATLFGHQNRQSPGFVFHQQPVYNSSRRGPTTRSQIASQGLIGLDPRDDPFGGVAPSGGVLGYQSELDSLEFLSGGLPRIVQGKR